MRRRPAALALALATMGAAVGGCADPVGDLDRERLRELARTPGDAVGDLHSGTWTTLFELERCTCRELAQSFSPCVPSEPPVPLIGTLALVEADGLLASSFSLQLSNGNRLGATFSGGVDADGSFVLAAVRHDSTVGVTSDLLSRIDGAFDEDGGASFEATLAVRLATSLAVEVEGLPQHLDCRGDYSLTGTR